MPLLSKKFYLNLLNKCSARRLLLFLVVIAVGGFILYHTWTRVHETTYFWQVTELATMIRPIKRTSCDWESHNNQSRLEIAPSKLKIGVASIYADNDNTWNDKLMERALQNRIDYCSLHNYEFINANNHIDHTRPVAWSKLLLYRVLPDYDYLVYIDMDVVIMDMSRSIEEFISAAPENMDFIMTQDWSGPNTGE
jgi:galactosyl transferase GMA12/MNN10 family